MCQFISWIEHKDKNYYITKDLLQSKEGRAFVLENGLSDIMGHDAIRALYPELGPNLGVNKECDVFSDSNSFPKDIVKDIKAGRFEGVGVCLDILNKRGRAEYRKIEQSALAEYKKIQQPALAEYNKIQQPAWAEYNKIQQPAWAEYRNIEQSAFWSIAKQKKYRTKIWR